METNVIPVELSRIVIDETSDEQVIVLREVGGERSFPILIGIFEATVIDRIVKGRGAPRPLTHDLIAEIIHRLGGRLHRAEIDDLKSDTYYAKLVIALDRDKGREVLIDARPSDAVAVALQMGAPLFVAEKVMDQVAR